MYSTENLKILGGFGDAQLAGISFDHEEFWVRLIFRMGSSVKDVYLDLLDLAYFNFSKDPDDNEGCYLIGEVHLKAIENNRQELFSLLRFPFRDLDGEVSTYPSKPLFHFHLEGDVCVEALCGKYLIHEN
jgi:hypothetical protein